jgi:hypothetical protein
MDLNDFQHVLDAWGGDPRRWPADRRAAALALAGSDVRAAALLAQAQALDALLDQAPVQAPSLALRTRIAGAALDRGRSNPPVRGAVQAQTRSGRRWLAGAALVAACAAGAVTGVAAATMQAEPAHAGASADAVNEAARLLGESADLSEG